MPQPSLTAAQVITAFELQVSDVTELSSEEELYILNRVYQDLCSLHAWIWLWAKAAGSVSTDSEGTYIPVPDDFDYFLENNRFTENVQEIDNNASPKVVFMGSSYSPYQIVNYQDRTQYFQHSGVCYLDPIENKIRFPVAPTETTYLFDYVKQADDLELTDAPPFPGRFHDILVFGMALQNDVLQLSPTATAATQGNAREWQSTLEDLEYWNSQQILN